MRTSGIKNKRQKDNTGTTQLTTATVFQGRNVPNKNCINIPEIIDIVPVDAKIPHRLG